EVMTPGGVAYELEIPLTVYERLPAEGTELELRAFHVVREDGTALFGFLTGQERRLFARLVTASGIGPRLALAMMSKLPPERIVRAIADRDVDVLRTVPGIGKKTAERLVIELADRLDDLATGVAESGAPADQTVQVTVSALVALGYSSVAAAAAVRAVLDRNPGARDASLLKAALAELG
ncbi:MAG TPA: Holliday junction branch migration protein RuvA, partial [Longimicrobiales bacterium]|nr:Holliday junction branch migration protein RuvA [Longimicrobiales bacterium]